MKFSTSILYTIATALFYSTSVNADCQYIAGNYYCNAVSGIQYTGIGFQGSYNDVISMDETSCQCQSESISFSGVMSPLDEELSVHFRGPINLKQFGVYYPSSSSVNKRDNNEGDDSCTTTQLVHHQHKRAPAIEYAYVTKTVYHDANGNVITSETTTSAPGPANGDTTLATIVLPSSSGITSAGDVTTLTSSSSSSSSSSSANAAQTSSTSNSSGDWVRSSYFTPGSASNLVFMNNMGGTAGSGTWSSCFGNSISYCAADGISGASSPQALNDVTIASNKEFMIFSGTDCSDTSVGNCGYYRDGIPAHHGFAGANKIFVFEFQMPQATDSATFNYDMPAIWLLNAKIPRTLQYGNSACSCWATGCGEFDIFEILSSGSDKLISHLHDGQGAPSGSAYGGGGSADYISRPYASTMKAAVIFKDGSISIVVLDDSTTFDSSLSSSTVSAWLSAQVSVAQLT
jgi:hypothetical protein